MRHRPRVASLVFVATIGLAACGPASQMPLAQELAWERWAQCREDGATVQLKEIRPDGQIWVWYRGGTNDANDWQECIRKAADAQAQRRVAVTPPVASVVTAPAGPVGTPPTAPPPTSPAHLPMWKLGDEWAFRWDSPRGRGTYVWVVDRIEVVDGTPYYVVKSGTERESYWRQADLAYYMDMVGGGVEIRWMRTSGAEIRWPLEPGKTWEFSVLREDPKARRTADLVYRCRVDGEESLVVPAGTFSTLPVRCVEQRSGWFYERWWAPAVRHWVRERTQFSYGIREREMIGFRLR